MKNELDYSVYIERYLDGEMSGDEKQWFIRELKGNPALKRELGLRERLNEAIHETEIMDFRRQLESVFEESRVEIESKRRHVVTRRKIAAVSSSLMIAFAGILMLLLSYRNLDNQKIYEKYFNPAEAGLTFRSTESTDNSELQTAMQYYETGKYEQALSHFENILRTDPTRLGLNLYSGISQMEIKRYHDANKSFHRIIDNNYILYLEQAEWYLAFCYLMTDDIKKARDQFARIEDRNGYYQHQARKILRRIK
jgi:tetratricopeptide (TPR) repeat protein